MKKRIENRGGKRLGCGRKPTGRISITRSITLKKDEWNNVDSHRKELSPSKYFSSILKEFLT
jgi:hypothetical protein